MVVSYDSVPAKWRASIDRCGAKKNGTGADETRAGGGWAQNDGSLTYWVQSFGFDQLRCLHSNNNTLQKCEDC